MSICKRALWHLIVIFLFTIILTNIIGVFWNGAEVDYEIVSWFLFFIVLIVSGGGALGFSLKVINYYIKDRSFDKRKQYEEITWLSIYVICAVLSLLILSQYDELGGLSVLG